MGVCMHTVQMAIFTILSVKSVVHAIPVVPPSPKPTCTTTGSTITVTWQSDPYFRIYYAQITTVERGQPFALSTTNTSSVTLSGLASSTAYSVSTRALPVQARSEAWGPAWSEASDTIECRTAAEADSVTTDVALSGQTTKTMKVYRISEYSFDVDFLRNHDSASIEAMPLYLMTCADGHNCSPWDAKLQSPKWDQCHAAMTLLCPGGRGAAFNCMECADAHRDQLTEACGKWSDKDSSY